jgi:hypothetical protein
MSYAGFPLVVLCALPVSALASAPQPDVLLADYTVHSSVQLVADSTCTPTPESNHVPRAQVCSYALDTADRHWHYATVAAARGESEPEAFASIDFDTLTDTVNGDEQGAFASVRYYLTIEPTLLGQLFWPAADGVNLLLPIRIPYRGTWNLGASGAVARADLTFNYVPFAGASNERILSIVGCASSASSGPGAQCPSSSMPSGQVEGVLQRLLGVRRIATVFFSAGAVCFPASANPAMAEPHRCNGDALMDPMPELDRNVPPESYGLPAGANVEDYFTLIVSPNIVAGWVPPLFEDGFE